MRVISQEDAIKGRGGGEEEEMMYAYRQVSAVFRLGIFLSSYPAHAIPAICTQRTRILPARVREVDFFFSPQPARQKPQDPSGQDARLFYGFLNKTRRQIFSDIHLPPTLHANHEFHRSGRLFLPNFSRVTLAAPVLRSRLAVNYSRDGG